MMDEKKTFTGQGRAIRNLCEAVLHLDALGANPVEVRRVQELAKALLDSVPRQRGNPAIDEAIMNSVRVRQASSAILRAKVANLIRAEREAGAKTYIAIAESLNKKGIKPARAEKWTPGLIRSFDVERSKK